MPNDHPTLPPVPEAGSPWQSVSVLAALGLAAASAWACLVVEARDGMAMSPTMGLAFVPFLAIWVVMMIAMMFPTAAPMVRTFAKIQARRHRRAALWHIGLFVASYLALWSASAIGAYALAAAAETLAQRFGLSPESSARIGGALLISAGVYQLSPLKSLCLSKCRTPLAFIMNSWRPGARGALIMGWQHGLYCFGCCWLLFLILFPLGIMNIAAMAAVTALVFAEKVLPWGRWGAILSAALLIGYGAGVMAVPRILPTYADPATMDMKGMDMSGMDMHEMAGTRAEPERK